jgi:hypothetical protein
VNHARDQLLARSRRSEDEHGDIRLRGRADPLEDGEHLLVAADHLAEAQHRRRRVLDPDVGAPLEEGVDELRHPFVLGARVAIARRIGGEPADDGRLDELADAVVDVLAHAAERLHQRLDVERFVGARAQETEDARAQR